MRFTILVSPAIISTMTQINDPTSRLPDLGKIAIEKKPFETEVYDVMGGSGRWEVKIHDHGLVALCDAT